jgi:prepilin-type N-terminal cleavage/methylation domain-containing protein
MTLPKPALAKAPPSSSWRSWRKNQAFTLIELIVAIAITAIVGAVVFASSTYFLKRDRANAAAAELAGWLDALSAKAGSYGPCTVAFQQGQTISPGVTFASLSSDGSSASATECTATPNLVLPATDGVRSYSVAVQPSDQPLVFTPRAGVAANATDVTVKIVVNEEAPLRCVRISFATISIGVNNTSASTNGTCSVWEKT